MGNSTSKSEGNSGSSRQQGARLPLTPVTEKSCKSETKHQGEIDEKKDIAVRNLVFWRNGLQFHILEGEGTSKKVTKLSWLCPYEDPRSEVILKEITRGFVPPNLAVVKSGQLVEIHVLIQPKKEYANGAVRIIEPSGKPGNDDEPFDLKAYLHRIGCDRLIEQIRKSPQQTIETRSKKQGNMAIMHLKGGNLPVDIPTDDSSTQARIRDQKLEVAVRYLVFYHNGFHFQIREGNDIMHCSKLRTYDDPHSAEILKEITRGPAPTDILGLKHRQLLDLHVYAQLKDDFITTYVASRGTTLQQSEEASLNTEDIKDRADSNSDLARTSEPELPQRIGGIYPAKNGDAPPPRPSKGIPISDSADGQMITSGQEAFDIMAYLSHIGCSALGERLQGLLRERQGHRDDGGQQSEADQTGATDPTVFPAGSASTDGRQRAEAEATSGEPVVRVEKGEETAVRHVTFWHNGFQFSGTGNDELDAKLNKYDDPENKAVLEEILQETIRPGLLGVKPGQAVELIVAKRTEEDFPTAGKEFASGSQGRQDDTSQPSSEQHEDPA